jgi:hypothetical protein
MNKEFIPYEESLELRRLGFNELCICWHDSSCICWYNSKKELGVDILIGFGLSDVLFDQEKMDSDDHCLAPTFSQAFRWFREKHNLRCQINYIGGLINESTWWDISIIGHYNMDPKEWEMKYQPYEEAELACLRKLIELIK